MTAATARVPRYRQAAPTPLPRPEPVRRPALRVVAAPTVARSRVPFAVFCVGILVSALLAVLLLNIQMAQTAYDKKDLSAQLNRLTETGQSLQAQLEAASSPDSLAASASALGMVPAPPPAYIDLSTNSIIGTPTAAPAPTSATNPTPTAEPTPSGGTEPTTPATP